MSLRARTTVLVAVVTAALLVGGAVALDGVLRHRLAASADDLARSRVSDLLALAEAGDLPASLVNVTDDSVAQVVDDGGRVVAASPNIEGAQPLTDEPATGGLRVEDVTGPDDAETEDYRLWTSTGPAAGGGRVRVYVGTSLESVHEATASLRAGLRVGVPLLWLLIVAAAWLLVGRALRRLDRIREEVDTITEDDLSRRVGDEDRGDEVGRLASTMNRMLGRLEHARERQQRFLADVSHDLRSPLTAQRAQLEVALAHPGSGDDEQLHRDLLGHVAEMDSLVGDLLFVVTDDERPRTRRPLDLEDIVLEEAARVRRLGGPDVDTGAVSAAPVVGDPDELRRLVRNLVENAVAHATSRIELRAALDGEAAVVDVVDDGPGVPPGDEQAVFERFHRGDTARTRRGTGLGLSIARTIAERHGGTLVLVQDDARGAHFRLRLPGQKPLP
ncbi:MAG TPA: ATP-binding protein [Phycicoccus sp.]